MGLGNEGERKLKKNGEKSESRGGITKERKEDMEGKQGRKAKENESKAGLDQR